MNGAGEIVQGQRPVYIGLHKFDRIFNDITGMRLLKSVEVVFIQEGCQKMFKANIGVTQ